MSSWDDPTQTEEDSATRVYFKVAPEPPRTRIVLQPVRPGPRPVVGVLVGAICALIGIVVGGALAAGGVTRERAEAAPVVVAEKREPIVTPIVAMPAPVPVAAPAPVATPAPVAAPAPAPVPAPVVAAEPPPAPHHTHARAHHHHEAAPEAPAAQGTLAVTSKPPCAISIDGAATGLMTPQRSLPLSAGTHEVTLMNADEGIQLTTEVTISADHTTQLIQDFTK